MREAEPSPGTGFALQLRRKRFARARAMARVDSRLVSVKGGESLVIFSVSPC